MKDFNILQIKLYNQLHSISPLITIKNSNTIGIGITVTNGGNGYTDAPSVVIVNSDTGEKIDSGILEAKLSGNSIDSVSIIQQPKGLPETAVQLLPLIILMELVFNKFNLIQLEFLLAS
jgi:hypothetical protein